MRLKTRNADVRSSACERRFSLPTTRAGARRTLRSARRNQPHRAAVTGAISAVRRAVTRRELVTLRNRRRVAAARYRHAGILDSTGRYRALRSHQDPGIHRSAPSARCTYSRHVRRNDAAVATAVGLPVIAVLAAGPLARSPLARTKHLDMPADLPLRMREVREPAAYDRAMGLFRSAMGLFRGRAGKDREKAAAELVNEQARTVKAQPVAAREVKREARPDPNKPGWGRAID